MSLPPKRVLVVDDDAEIRLLIVDILVEDGYWVCPCSSGEQALEALKHWGFDLMLADIRMPRISGIDLLQQVRRMSLDTEVVLMTAYASVQMILDALRGEAFDVLIKPFSLKEFRERVRFALDARSTRQAGHAVRCHDELCIDLRARRVWKAEEEIKLSHREFDVLAYLFRHQGRAVSTQELLENVWEAAGESQLSHKTAKTCLCRLRKRIGDDIHDPHHIQNVYAEGYRLGD
jgi:two-component system KDP operon response regulator KdpE